MRFLAGVLVLALGLWAGYWFVGQRLIEDRLTAALGQAGGGAPLLTHSGLEVVGFPSRFDLTITSPEVFDPATGWGASADFAQVFAMTWKPWHLIAALPNSLSLRTPRGKVEVQSTRFLASLTYGPSADLPFEAAIVEMDAPAMIPEAGGGLSAERLVLALRRAPLKEPAYRLGLQVSGLGAGPETAPANLRLDAVVFSTAPLDRNAAEVSPEIAALDLSSLSIDWGTIRLTGEGSIDASPQGYAEGEIALRLSGWRDLPPALSGAGILTSGLAETLRRALEKVGQEQGNPEVLNLPLRFAEGLAYLGPQALGPAPLMVQRQ